MLDNKGSSSFNAVLAIVEDKYPHLHSGIMLAHTTKAVNLQKVILIDSQTMHKGFCNDKYVENIRKATKLLRLSTNVGGMTISNKMDVTGFYPEGSNGTVYFDKKPITNILSLRN